MKGMKLLGLRAKDKVTGFEGVVSSVSYDLYGCIQAVLTPAVGKDKVKQEGYWFDIKRLKILSKKPVIEVPDFGQKEIGAAEKPLKESGK